MKKHEKWILGLKLKKDHLSHLTCLWVIEFEIGAQLLQKEVFGCRYCIAPHNQAGTFSQFFSAVDKILQWLTKFKIKAFFSS